MTGGDLLGRVEGAGTQSQVVSWFSLQTGVLEAVSEHRETTEWKTTDVC